MHQAGIRVHWASYAHDAGTTVRVDDDGYVIVRWDDGAEGVYHLDRLGDVRVESRWDPRANAEARLWLLVLAGPEVDPSGWRYDAPARTWHTPAGRVLAIMNTDRRIAEGELWNRWRLSDQDIARRIEMPIA
jgi:hypothetical protein